jgi:hypothetical protein
MRQAFSLQGQNAGPTQRVALGWYEGRRWRPEARLSMVFRPVVDVFCHLGKAGLAHRERPIAILPSKRTTSG